MANHAYLRVWTRDFSEASMIEQFARFLATAPLSASQKFFDELVAQPVDGTEPPAAEWDLREPGYGPAEVAALAAQQLHSDTAYIVTAKWDIWSFDLESYKWRHQPQPLTLSCYGPEYDNRLADAFGHFSADLGFEHFFTGHGGILAPGVAANPFAASDHPQERAFRQWMSVAENRKEYHAKTRQNIQQLLNWVEIVERALPVERGELWSEGEENFEARLDVISAQH